jgi:hypothetical protein
MDDGSDGTLGKKPPAPSAKMRRQTGAETLGDMGSLALGSLYVHCPELDHHTTFNIDDWTGARGVPRQ